MSVSRMRFRRGALLALWTAVIGWLVYMPIPHTPFFCVRIEAFFNGLPDDSVVEAAKVNALLAIWFIGVCVCFAIAGSRYASRRNG